VDTFVLTNGVQIINVSVCSKGYLIKCLGYASSNGSIILMTYYCITDQSHDPLVKDNVRELYNCSFLADAPTPAQLEGVGQKLFFHQVNFLYSNCQLCHFLQDLESCKFFHI